MTDFNTLQTKWVQLAAATAKTNSLNKAVVFAALSEAGITDIVVGFDGEGDSGQIDGAAAQNADGCVEFPEIKLTLFRPRLGQNELDKYEMTLRGAVEELCYGYLEQEYGGWENNDGAFGEFRFHVAERRIALDLNERFTDYEHRSHVF